MRTADSNLFITLDSGLYRSHAAESTKAKSLTRGVLRPMHKAHDVVSRLNFKQLDALFRLPVPFNIFLKGSKYLHRMMLEGSSLIDFAPLRKVVHRVNMDHNGESIKLGDGTWLSKCQLPSELINKELASNLSQFVDDLLDDKFSSDLAFKPDGRASARGLVRIRKNDKSIKLSLLDQDSLTSPNSSLQQVLEVSKSFGIPVEKEDGLLNISVPLEAKRSMVKAYLHGIFTGAMRNFFIDKTYNLPCNTEYSALIEDWQDLVKINDKVIEARYFLDPTNDQVTLTEGMTSAGLEIESFMKQGHNSSMVNFGNILGIWPCMHQVLINELGLECTEDQFNQYMERLCVSIGKEFREQFGAICEDQEKFLRGLKGQKLALDIAWKKDELIRVPLNEEGETITVPKPILMEISLDDINFEELEKAEKELEAS